LNLLQKLFGCRSCSAAEAVRQQISVLNQGTKHAQDKDIGDEAGGEQGKIKFNIER
jgi:hypothetical protein